MRLELTPLTDATVTGIRRLERGEMTIGRDGACTLVVADESRMVSKVHCRILRDARGFLLRDESVNGVSLGGRELAEGETVRLSDGDEIGFCGHSLSVRIGGTDEPDWSDPDPRLALGDEAPSITAILSDVSPGGRSAAGPLPGRLGEDWMETAPAREDKDRLSRAEIGWRGPPPVSMLDQGLPEDWNATEAGSRNEHVLATGIRMRMPKAAGHKDAGEPQLSTPRPEPADDTLLDAFIQGYGATLEPAGDPRLFMRRMGRAMRDLVEHHGRVNAQSRDFAIGEGLDWPVAAIDPLDPRPGMETAEADHRRLLDAVRALLDEVDRLAPAAIEARAAVIKSASGSLKDRLRETAALLREGGPAWRGYREAYGANGTTPRRRFAERLATARNEPEAFEELNADQMQNGATG